MGTLLLILFLYFSPSIAAGVRGHEKTSGIVVLNLFLGWTFIGWVIAMVWAVS